MATVLFNEHGNLHETITLNYESFKKIFGYNEPRRRIIESALVFFKLFKSVGCRTIYITGSFLSKKQIPGDIDICIDASNLDYRALLKKDPEFLTGKNIETIKKEHKCHFAAFFDSGSRHILNNYKKDRQGNPRGFVLLDLNDIP